MLVFPGEGHIISNFSGTSFGFTLQLAESTKQY